MADSSCVETVHVSNPERSGTIAPAAEDITFEDLIAPLDRAEFLADYWEKKPFVSRGKPGDFFRGLFSVQDVDKVVVHHKPKPGHLDLVSEHGFVRDNFLNADQTSNINLVYQNYLKGSTVILSGLETSWPPLNRFCRALEGDLNHQVGVAVYLTPPDTKGVKPHYDTQEGFLIQIDGAKRWKVYEPVYEFPPVEGSYTSIDRERLSEPIFDVALEPGDVLYIPRGFPHEGISLAGKPSLHITLEVHVRTWFDFLSDALAALADQDTRFRRSVPVGFLHDPKAESDLKENFELFKNIFNENCTLQNALHKHVEHVVVNQPPIPDGHFATLFENIELHTPIKKRQVNTMRLFKANQMTGMQFSGNQISGPKKIEAALEFIEAAAEPFSPAELPGDLSAKEKLVLANRLIKIGLLTLA